ncbi:MAG TPA: hypothetical protein VNV66_12185, partial [Pilimelia sp.]|nr:hypothetical protein [Pilimelia sp.]
MRIRPALLTSAGLLAATHVVGVLFDSPILRSAEVLALLLLAACALVVGWPRPRWALPAALVAPAVHAARTMPPPADSFSGYFLSADQTDGPSTFVVGLRPVWA